MTLLHGKKQTVDFTWRMKCLLLGAYVTGVAGRRENQSSTSVQQDHFTASCCYLPTSLSLALSLFLTVSDEAINLPLEAPSSHNILFCFILTLIWLAGEPCQTSNHGLVFLENL